MPAKTPSPIGRTERVFPGSWKADVEESGAEVPEPRDVGLGGDTVGVARVVEGLSPVEEEGTGAVGMF